MQNSGQFINAKTDIVTEAVDGIVASSSGLLARLDGYPFIRVVVRTDWDKSKVALISGGGSGHEPAHAGFVGHGMLTAAVCGDVFASPSVEAVLAGILAVTGDAGCVLIVKNYTGDRLNFGLAAERARALGRKVNLVFVQDDIAIADLSRPRGLAGTLFVHKIAGAVAESGADLEAVTAAAQRASDGAMTIGLSLDTCTVPGSAKEDRIATDEVELGLGIHGEPGVQNLKFEGARQVVAAMVAKLAPKLNDGPYVALLNNLGGTSELEMAVLTDTLRTSEIGAKLTHIVGPASMMTSIDMHGFSISVCPLTSEDEAHLAAPTAISAWPGLKKLSEPGVVAMPEGVMPPEPVPSSDPETAKFLTSCCETLIAAEKDLNELDAKSGDGDTGSTLTKAARALIGSLDRLPLADHTLLLRAIGQELSQTMGGSSGVLLAIFFAAASDASENGQGLTASLKAGLARMQEIGGAKLGDRTMVDALSPALDALDVDIASAAKAARAGAIQTGEMTKANSGRAAYVNKEQLLGNVDPGAEAVARFFEHLAKSA